MFKGRMTEARKKGRKRGKQRQWFGGKQSRTV